MSATGKRIVGVVDQVKQAMKGRNRVAMSIGAVFGGFVPVATFVLAHFEFRAELSVAAVPPVLIVLGGLTYSAKTVYEWALIAFKHWVKAVAFVVLLEGVMTFATTRWLSATALVLLVVVNAIAVGTNLVNDQRENR